MNWQSIVILVIIICAAAAAAVYILRHRKHGCGGNCAGCDRCGKK